MFTAKIMIQKFLFGIAHRFLLCVHSCLLFRHVRLSDYQKISDNSIIQWFYNSDFKGKNTKKIRLDHPVSALTHVKS